MRRKKHIILTLTLSIATALLACDSPAPPRSMDRTVFRCYAVSESARTVASARYDRKKRQIKRIKRLLDTGKLEELDEGKLKAEYAILIWDAEDARFLRDCAESYYRPGSTHLRETFEGAPTPLEPQEAHTAFSDALDTVPERMLPHGFQERAEVHIAESLLLAGKTEEALELAEAKLKEKPDGLYSDTFELVIADAHLELSHVNKASAIYERVAKLKIGLDAHYARYRLAQILRASGDAVTAAKLEKEIADWSRRGDREALEKVLRRETPTPPLPKARPPGAKE